MSSARHPSSSNGRSSNMMIPLSSPRPEEESFRSIMSSLAPDLPLLMFGSGDVDPHLVNPDTVAMVAELTGQYISKLVDAAVDAHDILTDGAGGLLPPPSLPERRRPHKPLASLIEQIADDAMSAAALSQAKKTALSKTTDKRLTTAEIDLELKRREKSKRRRAEEDFWDLPLPEPKIRKKSTSTTTTIVTPGGTPAAASSSAASSNNNNNNDKSSKNVDPNEWVGISGVDFFETSRSRKSYVGTPTTINTKCFIFPICHDAGLYGRVMEVQAARRAITPVLTDPVWMEAIRAESKNLRKKKRRSTHYKKSSASGLAGGKDGKETNDNGDVVEEEPDDDEDDDNNIDLFHQAMWPGLEFMLPTHRNDNDDNNK